MTGQPLAMFLLLSLIFTLASGAWVRWDTYVGKGTCGGQLASTTFKALNKCFRDDLGFIYNYFTLNTTQAGKTIISQLCFDDVNCTRSCGGPPPAVELGTCDDGWIDSSVIRVSTFARLLSCWGTRP